MTWVRFTHIGGPTMLIEFEGWSILTDPTFDPPGRRYGFGWGTRSTKVAGPALAPTDLPPLDAVILSHDHHADNLDDEGKAVLGSAATVVTTRSGAKRLGSATVGLNAWESTSLEATDKPTVTITATPCRHGPPLSRPIVGDVIGFDLVWEGQEHGSLWISGDTVLFDGLRQVPHVTEIGTAVIHMGRVRFGITGPLTYTMGANDALRLVDQMRPRTVIPVHYEGWTHFREGRDDIARTVASFGHNPFEFLAPGVGVGIEV